MAVSAADLLNVICTMEGMSPAGSEKQLVRKPAECPCSTLCQSAAATASGLPDE